MNKKSLWLRLRNYHFDHVVAPGLWDHITAKFGHTNPSLKAFAGKIARKHGWKNAFALRAIEEYKKFVYLGTVSDFQVTPSKIIDVVWHEHILFSKAYREFCQDVLQHPFDHHPELIPMQDQTGRFSAQYLDTISLYQTEFNIEPPIAIWGDTKFEKEMQEKNQYQSAKKRKEDQSTGYSSDGPLYTSFESEPAADYPEFSGYGDGDFGGAGAGGDWSDGGDSGAGDSGGGDGGGCSGGCGGGD
jgi:hypothetical protein